MKLLISRRLPEANMAEIEGDARFDVTTRTTTQPMSRDECVAALADYDIILPTLGDLFSTDVFEATRAIRCKLLANFGVGYNHIDVVAARAHGIEVTNTPGAVTDATADIALTLMLMTARRAGEGERMLRADGWDGWHPTQMLGFHLSGKQLGVIGMGRIGQAIAHRCRAGLGMNVVYYNRSEKAVEGAEQLPSAEDVCAQADVVVMAVPGGAETHHLMNETMFAAMQPHAIFVNIARGDVVNEAALVAALQAKQIAGAGLDVYEFEPKVPAALKAMENVVLLPHLGTAALEVREDMGRMALANVMAFAAKSPVPNAV